MALLTKRQSASILALLLSGLFIAPAAHSGPLAAAKAPATSAVIAVDHDWDDDDYYEHYYARRYYRRTYPRYDGRTYYDRPRYSYRRNRHADVDAPFASVRVRPRGVWVRAPFVRLYVPRY